MYLVTSKLCIVVHKMYLAIHKMCLVLHKMYLAVHKMCLVVHEMCLREQDVSGGPRYHSVASSQHQTSLVSAAPGLVPAHGVQNPTS